jgi:hypothetical protein
VSAYETSIPGASVYAGADLLAKTAYQKSLARINQQRGDTIRQAGFTANIDPTTGMVAGLGVDPNNQYGDFQGIRRDHALQDESARWAGQARGLGTGGGLAAQLRNNIRFGFGRDDAKFGQDLSGALAGYTDQQVQAGQTRDAALYQAELAAAQQAQQNGDYSPTDYSSLPVTKYGVNDAGDGGDPSAPKGNPWDGYGGTAKTGVKSGTWTAPKKPSSTPAKKILPPPKPIGSSNRSAAVPTKKKK